MINPKSITLQDGRDCAVRVHALVTPQSDPVAWNMAVALLAVLNEQDRQSAVLARLEAALLRGR